MRADLLELWDRRDRAVAQWGSFAQDNPRYTVAADHVQQATHLLDEIYEVERLIRVATGHEKIKNLLET